jgi:diguanylate cyclase (GGDEF)-like protein
VGSDERLNFFSPEINDTQAALQRDVDQRLFSERWRIVQGAVTITVAIATAIWSQVNPQHLTLWIMGYAAWITIAFLSRSGLKVFEGRDRYQTPTITNLINTGRGLWICAIAFVNWQAFAAGGEYFWIILTLWSATIAGGMIYTTVGNDYFIQSVLATAGILTAAARQWPVCIGIVMFLLMAIKALDRARQTRISEVHLRTKLAHQAQTDSLTGLWNRVGLAEQLLQLPDGPLAAMFIDLDRFKEVNDRLGHTAGDELLNEVAQRLRQVVNSHGILARLGGDEFFVVLPNCPLSELLAIADQAISALEQPFILTAGQAYISASIGTATQEDRRTNVEQLITDSDEAMYRAKKAGRRRVVYYDDALRRDAQQRLGLESNLRQAIAERDITAWGQPILDRTTSEIAKVELLARWQLGQNYIPPNLFIDIATDIGLTSEIAKIMVDHARDCLQQWRHIPTLQDTCATVNIESQDLVEGLIVDYIYNVVLTGQVDPDKLILEITERGLIEAEAKARFQIDRLHQLGIRVAIDDFGSGYSSIRSVMTLPVDLLKLDRSLVSAGTQDQRMQKALGAMVEMSTSFNITVIGEGIETAADLEVMKALNVDLLQGFYCARPMPIEALERFSFDLEGF